ncbi:MAG: TPM domain-containing protein [Pirellulales bacterium]
MNPHRNTKLPAFACMAIGLCWLIASSAWALPITLEPPGEREFIRDLANIISAEDEEAIRAQCDKLLTDKATPIIVVTINSMAEHDGSGLSIESFATLLFNQWQIGHAKINGQSWDTGILLVVSKEDRRARIELGRGWGRREDGLCQQIMDEQIIFHFKQGQFSEGITAGVNGLDKMGRGLEIPIAPTPWWHYAVVIGFIGLGIFTVVSLIRQGASGWAWLFWGVVFTVIGTVLYHLSQNSGGGSGFSGGAFGGGSSGGGGASGSW